MSDLTPEQMEARIKQLSGYLVKADERVIELQAQVEYFKKEANDSIDVIVDGLGETVADKEVKRLQEQVKELEDPGWEQFINLATQWLEKYPPDIFTGESGDPGPLFVVALRSAIAALQENE